MTAFSMFKPTLLIAGVFSISVMGSVSEASDTREIPAAPYQAQLAGISVSFLARDLETRAEFVLEGSDLQRRHAPNSTFKIANLLIALETGAAGSLDHRRTWDPQKRPAESYWPEPWRQDQTLGEAFARSTVWYYQDLALEVGADEYRERLSRWNYGNAEVAAGSDDFWLDGSLRISPEEQVAFLEGLVEADLDVSPENVAALDRASLSTSGDGWTLHGKTGLGPVDYSNFDGAYSGWYVGYLRREDKAPVVFALHASGPTFASIAELRRPLALDLLEDVGLMGPRSGD